MKKVKGKILGVIGVLAVLGIYYYAALPAFNIHSMEFWILQHMRLRRNISKVDSPMGKMQSTAW